jgi:hypothetical protein
MSANWLGKIIWVSLITVIALLAWTMQDAILLKGDLSWQMHMARIVLNGGTYVKDFFEINPPLSIYLYMFPVLLQKYGGISCSIALRLCVYVLCAVSLMLCARLAKKIFQPKDINLKNAFLVSVLVVYLIVPLSEFGQRECLLLYLVMPYFLLISARLSDQKTSLRFSLLIGVLAGIGFSIKPFFLIAFMLVELLYLYRSNQRQITLWANFRPETICLALVGLLYLVWVMRMYPDYIDIVVPIARRFYYTFMGEPWSRVLLADLTLYSAFILILYTTPLIKDPYPALTHPLSVALIGFLLAYAWQQIPWYYHLYPALALALILCGFMFTVLLNAFQWSFADVCIVCLAGILFFAYPLHYIWDFYGSAVEQKKELQPLIDELHKTELNQPVYFFSCKTAYMVSVFEHAGVKHASRLQFLAWMTYYLSLSDKTQLTVQQQADENFFVTMLSDDLQKNKPKLIYVDNNLYETHHGDFISIHYLDNLSQYPQFRKVWQAYHYKKTIYFKANSKAIQNVNFDVYAL